MCIHLLPTAVLLNCVVTFMETPDTVSMVSGYMYAALLALSAFAGSLCSCHFNLLMTELGIKVRAALVTAVYDKTVTVSRSSLATFSTGQIINFMSTDTDRVNNFGPSVHAAWSLPFQFTVTLVLLYQQVGVSFLAGVIITVLLVPVNKAIAARIGTLSTKMMAAKDARVSVMSELLAGIRVIKCFTWEDVFSSRVDEARRRELRHLAGRKYLDALCVYLWATTPVLISVLTFVIYVLLGNTLTAARVFTSVALFAMLTGPLNAFPWVLNGLVEATVSIRRLEKFFCLPEFNPELYYSKLYDIPGVRPADDSDIVLHDASFTHKAEEGRSGDGDSSAAQQTFHLKQLNLSVKSGQFVGVVGPVGAGKSALLDSLLGEMQRAGGRVAVTRGRGVGLVKQEPWLQQGTVRDNILWGKAYQFSWYTKVVEACALKQDFSQLARGDLTQVGEGGVTLSGGQRARVALARAVYQDKDLYLIDDIFSAVDGDVAGHIYRRCILGLLRHKTRVLATHHARYVAAADTIARLEEGRLVSLGPAASLASAEPGASLVTSPSGRTSPSLGPLDTAPATPQDTSPGHSVSHLDTEVQDTEAETRETGSVKLKVYR